MEGEDYRDSEVEVDSDHEDQDSDMHGFMDNSHPLHFHTDLDSSETGTVRRRAKTIVTPKMAMESFRLSFLNDDQDINFDAILGELTELENQLTTTQSQLTQSLGGGGGGVAGGQVIPRCTVDGGGGGGGGGNDTIQAELDALAAEITSGLGYKKTNGQLLLPPVTYEHVSDAGETDSAFSDAASLPSSESFTSMATVSSSAETTSSSSGETCSITSAMSSTTVMNEEEQLQRLKAEKIRIALEKIKEAKIRKLFVRAFAKDGSSKSILVDEKMTVGQVCALLADKHHGRLTHSMTVIEHMPELFMERILEDHDSLVENMVMWTRDSKNKVLFEERQEKSNLFFEPEKYLLCGSSSSQKELGSTQRERLIQEFFSPAGVSVPEVEGALYLKSDGKKAWKKYFFVLRASGLYYNPKGKVSKAPKDLVMLVQFDFVEVYRGLGWKKKYHSPTDFCFALKHPQIQKKTSKYIRYFCAESEYALDQWIMGIRIAKLGKQLLHNFEQVHHEIATWDLRQATTALSVDNSYSGTSTPRLSQIAQDSGDHYQSLNQSPLPDTRLLMPQSSPQHTISSPQHSVSSSPQHSAVAVNHNSGVGAPQGYGSGEVGKADLSVGHQRKSSEGGGEISGGHKTPTKRVSFSTTHSIITDSCEQLVTAKHRDSIVSASTDSSEESNSSGEGRHIMANTLRGKMRPKLPVTTETTRLLTEMNQLSFDGDGCARDGGYDETSSLSSASSTSSSRHNFSRTERRRSSMTERRGSEGRAYMRTNGVSGGTPMSPSTTPRRASHEGSPVHMSPSMRHSGTQQWVDDYYSTVDGIQGYDVQDTDSQYMYSGGMSHYEQIPHHKHQAEQSFQQPHHHQQPQYQQQHPLSQPSYQQHQAQQHYQQQPYEHQQHLPPEHPPDLSSELYATVQKPSRSNATAQKSEVLSSEPSPPVQRVPNAEEEVFPPPPPPEFQECIAPPLPPPLMTTQPKASAPPTAPKPSGPPPTPPVAPKQPPPPVLPKSVPNVASPGPPVSQRSPPTKSNIVGSNPGPGSAAPRPSVPPPVPPAQPSPSPGKVGPPTLPKSSASTPASPHGDPGSLKFNRGVSTAPPQSPVSASSAPPTLAKPGSAPPGCGSSDAAQYAAHSSQHAVASPSSSPHRVSHVKHPSTGSPMLGMGPSPPNNQGPTPSDSGYIEGDNSSSCSGSPSNPAYLQELARRHKGPNPGTSPPQSQAVEASGQHTPPAHHRRSASAGSAAVKGAGKPEGGRRAPPPPPPKRSENTRLTGDVPKQVTNTPPASPAPHQPSHSQPQGAIYENYEGIMDINELPPPPPELLAGLPESATKNSSAAGVESLSPQRMSKKQQKLPPPPPKRSKETHLTQSH